MKYGVLMIFISMELVLAKAFIDPAIKGTVTADFRGDDSVISPINLYVDVQSGSTEDQAIEVYYPYARTDCVPVCSSANKNNEHLSTIAATGLTDGLETRNILPFVDNALSGGRIPKIIMTIYHNDGANRKIYVAVKEGDDDFELLTPTAACLAVASGASCEVIIDLYEICSDDKGEGCNIESTDTDLKKNQNIILYGFTTEVNDNPNSSIDPIDDYPDGVFFDVKFSNINKGCNTSAAGTCTDASTFPILLFGKKGDAQVKLKYTVGFMSHMDLDDLLETRVFSLANNTIPIRNIAQLVGSKNQMFVFPAAEEQELTVNNLVNNQTYIFSLVTVNKWQFATVGSVATTLTPQAIDTFLQEQSCYLLSAGFGTIHPTVNFFRAFRDEVLLPSNWGRQFVTMYYETAPTYATQIYQTGYLQNVIQNWSKFLADVVALLYRPENPRIKIRTL